jgi:cobalt transporter subunit CbtA
MAVFRSIVFSAALAGLIVGALVTALQHFGTVPLILRAEVYERLAEASVAHEHAAAEGFQRNAYTALFNVVEWIGFGLLLNGAFVLLGRAVTWREGLLWGLGGFAAFVIAPGLGLPPELPGVPAAALMDRQLWWAGTVLATAIGLGLVAFRREPVSAMIGILLIMAPHLAGAPRLDHVETNVPGNLSHAFIVVVTLTALPCWALLGALTGHFYRKFWWASPILPAPRAREADGD